MGRKQDVVVSSHIITQLKCAATLGPRKAQSSFRSLYQCINRMVVVMEKLATIDANGVVGVKYTKNTVVIKDAVARDRIPMAHKFAAAHMMERKFIIMCITSPMGDTPVAMNTIPIISRPILAVMLGEMKMVIISIN